MPDALFSSSCLANQMTGGNSSSERVEYYNQDFISHVFPHTRSATLPGFKMRDHCVASRVKVGPASSRAV